MVPASRHRFLAVGVAVGEEARIPDEDPDPTPDRARAYEHRPDVANEGE